jgi:membrane-associated phospholipid phosphatase
MQMIRAVLIFLILIQSSLLMAQSDTLHSKMYHTRPKLTLGVSVAFFTGSYFTFQALDNYASFTEADVLKLNPENINSFDRPIAFNNPANFKSAQSTSDLLMSVSVPLPVFLFLDKKMRNDWQDIMSLFLLSHMANNTLYFGSVLALPRARPLTFNPAVSLEDKIGVGKDNSFFSGHTSWAAVSTFFMAKIYTDYHHIKGWKRVLIYTGASIPPLAVGYYRTEAGKHFRSDVLIAFAIGATCGIVVPELHRNKKRKENNLSFQPFSMQGATGVTLTYALK